MLRYLFKTVDSPREKIRKDIKKLAKHVLTIYHNKKDYKLFELSEVYDMPNKRYQIMNDFIEDARLNIQKKELEHYLTELEGYLDENTAKGLTNATILTKWLKARTKISMDVDLVMRVLSACLIFEDEDPLDYDWDINDFKIELFEKYGVTAFFLSEPIGKYLKLISTSNIDIEKILDQRKKQRVVLKELEGMGISVWNTSTENTNETNIT